MIPMRSAPRALYNPHEIIYSNEPEKGMKMTVPAFARMRINGHRAPACSTQFVNCSSPIYLLPITEIMARNKRIKRALSASCLSILCTSH